MGVPPVILHLGLGFSIRNQLFDVYPHGYGNPEIWPFGSPRFLVANKGPQGLIAAVSPRIRLGYK